MSNASQTNPNMHTVRFAIEGMTCQACASRLEKVLSKKPAISQVMVNFASETATVSFDTQLTDSQEIADWIAKTGFSGTLVKQTPRPSTTQSPPWSLIGLWLISMPFWVGMAGMMVGSHALMMPVWLQFVLATVVQFGFGLGFYQGAYASIKGRLANMDVLVALGTTAIWAYSSYIWWFVDGHEVYFEASVMVIAFVSLGKFLEQRTKKQGLDSLSALMALIPKTALVKKSDMALDDNDWTSTPIAKINVNDILLARQGDRVAVDGVIVEGMAYINEAHLTGESQLLKKQETDKVLAGSVVSEGSFCYQATATGQDTVLSDMIQALDDAQGTKADIARIADKVAGVFVPVVVVIASLTLVANYLFGHSFDVALMRAVAVLVIACPCALGLATPAAIMAGMGVAARHGVVFKDATSLEMAGKIDVMVFDKTGTLTLGTPAIQAVGLLADQTEKQALQITASLEQYAAHPLAHTLVQAAKSFDLPLLTATHIQTVVGQGIMGVVSEIGHVKVGTPAFVGVEMPQDDVWQIASVVAVSVDDKPIAVYALSDELKSDSLQVIDKLKADGVTVVIMSGDNQSVVDFVAKTLGIDQAYGKLLPRDKVNKIKEIQSTGKKVAMVGDGINDAPAMALADASFAVGGASDIAKHTASAHLAGNALTHAYYAQKIAKATLHTIKQNLFFAFVYNCIGIFLAIVGLLNPMIAALAMALSSVSVLTNAMRLKKLTL